MSRVEEAPQRTGRRRPVVVAVFVGSLGEQGQPLADEKAAVHDVISEAWVHPTASPVWVLLILRHQGAAELAVNLAAALARVPRSLAGEALQCRVRDQSWSVSARWLQVLHAACYRTTTPWPRASRVKKSDTDRRRGIFSLSASLGRAMDFVGKRARSMVDEDDDGAGNAGARPPAGDDLLDEIHC